MKFLLHIFLLLCVLVEPCFAQRSAVSVKGYTRKDGTYVAPHMRSAPDGNFNNNWSTKGNVNPYTGKEGTLNPHNSNLVSEPTSLDIPLDTTTTQANLPQKKSLIIPQNAKLNYMGDGWECQKGFRQSGLGCAVVDIPQNAKLNYMGNGWECQKGFRQSGSGCAVVDIPQNAKLNYMGNGWECQKGFRQSDSGCVAEVNALRKN